MSVWLEIVEAMGFDVRKIWLLKVKAVKLFLIYHEMKMIVGNLI
jgi:hypothetical protein